MQDKKQQNVIFSSVLEELMDRDGTTQAQLAAHLGLTQAAVSNYLQGRIPKSKILLELSEFFGVSLDYLLTGVKISEKEAKEGRPSGTNSALEPLMKCIEKSSATELKRPEFAVQNFPPFVHTAVEDYFALAREDLKLARQVAEIISVYRKSVQKSKTTLS